MIRKRKRTVGVMDATVMAVWMVKVVWPFRNGARRHDEQISGTTFCKLELFRIHNVPFLDNQQEMAMALRLDLPLSV